MTQEAHVRLVNADGELIAEGPCELDERGGVATFAPEREPGVLEKERGELRLLLDSGREVSISDRPMVFRIGSTNQHGRRRLYRLWLTNDAQDANAADAVGEGAPAPPSAGLAAPERGETPAAR